MSSSDQMSDDDESLEQIDLTDIQEKAKQQGNIEDTVTISSDDDTVPYMTSDEEELPEVNVKQRTSVIKNLFPTKPSTNRGKNFKDSASPSSSRELGQFRHDPAFSMPVPQIPRVPGFVRDIGGVKVHLPVEPYGSQVVLMYKLITGINKNQNCLLESPTGSGKTLALLCGALAWQQQEQSKILQNVQTQFNENVKDWLNRKDAGESGPSTPQKTVPLDNLFGKVQYGERSIYDKPVQNGSGTPSKQQPMQDQNYRDGNLYDQYDEVTIHKKRRIGSPGEYSVTPGCSGTNSPRSKTTSQAVTPEKPVNVDQPETPENVRTPVIYYGARTHKQLQQVIKEFGRTSFCGSAKMTILSSRDHSCIREFDRAQWTSKNDMCRGCVKLSASDRKKETNCQFYDNYRALHHGSLPPAFDLEDLVTAGEEIRACPYYAARAMAHEAQIVFCPYNYLIEPGIRASMQIHLNNNIVIIDEAHNIEDICRDAATFTITEDNVKASILELENCTKYRYANQDCLHYLDYILDTLKKWEQWFRNQLPLVNNKPVNNNEAVHAWETEHFVQTLNNHNIGEKQYSEFNNAADTLVSKLREDIASLYGVTQATGTLVESIDTALGYIFREEGKHKCDFKPLLIRTVYNSELSEAKGWRSSQFNNSIDKDTLSLRLLCLNPAIVFSQLSSARSIVLASGTLTPLLSLHSELGTAFPLQVSPNHVIPADRVWIGTLTTSPDGSPLTCTSRESEQAVVQDSLGAAVHWVCSVTPSGVLCFLPSYAVMNRLTKRWQETGMWRKLTDLKHVFMESRSTRDHNEVMEDFYQCVATSKGALLFAVYRGKVSEGMDFKDHQARAVITIGVPFPNVFDIAVKEKMTYNDKYCKQKNLLNSREWLRVQAYRALNQAVGRCVRHKKDWGAVLLIDSRFEKTYYTEHLSKWVKNFLGNNHHTFESLVNSANGLETFMQNMAIRENEDEGQMI